MQPKHEMADALLLVALGDIVRDIVREELTRERSGWRWLTTQQASELLGISAHRIAARVREGKLPGRKYGGRTYVDRIELEKQLARRGNR